MNILAVIVSLLGLPLGYLLANIFPEEVSTGRKYFVLSERIIYAIIVLIYSCISPLFLLLLLALFFHFRPIFVFILFIFFPSLLAASVILIYGLIVGTLVKMKAILNSL